jgi:hypothetical protein
MENKMQKTATHTPRRPAPKLASRTASSPPPRLGRNVAFRDIQVPQKEKSRDVETKNRTVFELAAIEPIKAARRCQADISAMNSGFREETRRHIAEAYAIACALENNAQAWRSFIDDEFWQLRKRPPKMEDQREPLLPVMVFVFNAIDRNIYKRAQKYAAGLKQYWIDNVPAREVAAKIEEDGGIEALSQASAESKPKKKQKPEQSSKLTFSASEARRGSLLALSEGQEAHLIIRRVTGERGVVARIVRFDPVKA